MNIFNTCVAFTIVLLGLAYPIVIQLISNDKFSSESILKIFDSHWKYKSFKISLIATLLIILSNILLAKFISLSYVNCYSWILKGFNYVLLFFTASLVFFFFKFIGLVKIFYRAPILLNYLIIEDNVNQKKQNYSSFDAISDLLLWSIEKQNTPLAKEISRYLYTLFRDYETSWKGEKERGIIYPDKYYNVVYTSLEKILKQENNSLTFLEDRLIGIWFRGEINDSKISNETYQWMWYYIILCANNNRYDLIFSNWKKAHQFYDYNIPTIQPDIEFKDGEMITKNEELISKRNEERERFLEFYYVLGGLLIFMGENKTIKKIFIYTQSIPPTYPLLPSSMNQVFQKYFLFFDPYNNFPGITTKYDFPDLHGIQAEESIKGWIYKYISILFIRQFHLSSYYGYEKPISKPNFPEELAEKRFWLENLESFRNSVNSATEDSQLLNDLRYKSEKEKYLAFFDKLSAENSELDDEKVASFKLTTEKILLSCFSEFKELYNEEEFKDIEVSQYNIIGESTLIDKTSYLDDSTSNLNFHSFLGDRIANKYRNEVAVSFILQTTIEYVVNEEDVFKSIEQLSIGEEQIIIVFGFEDLSYFKTQFGLDGLSKNHYKNTKIITYPYFARGVDFERGAIRSLFVLNKCDLPSFEHVELSNEEISLYKLEKINTEFNIYTAILELSKNTALKDEFEKKHEEKLSQKVWQGISFRTILKWRKDFKMIRIDIKNNFDNQKKVVNPSAIDKF